MTLGWTEIIVAFFTLLGCCAWFVEGRKHRPTANGLKADNRLKDMELARLYVQQFEETIGNPLRKQVGDLQNEIAQLRYAIQRIDYCAHRDDCPVLDGMRKQPKGDGVSSRTEERRVELRDTVRETVLVAVHDTLQEVVTITIDRNEAGDTLRLEKVTDRTRSRSRDDQQAIRSQRTVERDSVSTQRDSVAVEDKKIGLSASTDEKESWSTKTARLLKWTCAVIVALGALIIIIRVCYHR